MNLTAEKKEIHVLGTNHNNNMANQKGLDEIDLWALGIGNAERQHNSLRPRRRHAKSRTD